MSVSLLDMLPAPAAAPGQREGIVGMLGLLAELGCNRHVIECLAEMAAVDVGKVEVTDWLHGPLVVHRAGGWEDRIPPWLKRAAIAERWAIVAGQMEGHIVGPSELAAVMMPATFQAPLGSNLTDLYCWASAHASARHRLESGTAEEIMTKAGYEQPIPDAKVLTRGGRLWHDYHHLAHEIRRKVAAVHAAQRKELARQGRAERAPTAPPHKVAVAAEQFALFG